MRTCLAVLAGGVLVLGLAVGAWLTLDLGGSGEAETIRGATGERSDADRGVALAERAEAKIIALGRSDSGEASFTAAELNGWIRHRLEGFFPNYVTDVAASFSEDDRFVLTGNVVVERVPQIDRIGAAARLLGDTARAQVRGRVDGLRAGQGLFSVETIQIGPIPLPDALRDELVRSLRSDGDSALSTNTVRFELPPFVSDVAVRGGLLVLKRERRRG